MKKIFLMAGAGIIIIGAASLIRSANTKTVTIKGEVVDTLCYMKKGSRGDGHAACALGCIENGIDPSIVDAEGNVYLTVGAGHDPSGEELKNFVAKQVAITGFLYSKGGLRLLVIKSVKEL